MSRSSLDAPDGDFEAVLKRLEAEQLSKIGRQLKTMNEEQQQQSAPDRKEQRFFSRGHFAAPAAPRAPAGRTIPPALAAAAVFAADLALVAGLALCTQADPGLLVFLGVAGIIISAALYNALGSKDKNNKKTLSGKNPEPSPAPGQGGE